MCGIAGRFGDADPALVARMTAALGHRGPDGQATATLAHGGVGSTRLSLLDLERGAQPMAASPKGPVLVFNGEIYNHASLRRELEGLGHGFRSRSDTEVVLRAYQAWGPACLERLEGMYALAVLEERSLLLARDPFGIKPLVYHLSSDGRALCFASEIKALLVDERVPRTVDRAALVEAGCLGYVLGSRTHLAAIRQLAPGSSLRATLGEDGRVRLDVASHGQAARAGRSEAQEAQAGAGDEDALLDLLEGRLVRAVQSQMCADHPVGLLLSGGIDSSLVAAAMAPRSAGPIETFTFADHAEHPDLLASRQVAASVGARHHEFVIAPADLLRRLPAATAAAEAPAPLNFAFVTAPLVREHVKAVLCAEGADELFAGYFMHASPGACIRQHVDMYNRMVREGGPRTQDCAALKAVIARLVGAQPQAFGPLVYELYLDSQLANSHLWVLDRCAMAASLEVRVPFLDTAVGDLARALDWSWKVREGHTKYLLRRLAWRMLPRRVAADVIERKKLTAVSAFRQTNQALLKICRRLVPPDHMARHPFAGYLLSPRRVLSFDLFFYVFVMNGGQVPDGFALEDLYTSGYADLRAHLAEAARDTAVVAGAGVRELTQEAPA